MNKVRVAAVQAVSLAATWDEKWEGADVAHALDLLDRAAGGGAELACLLELYPLVGRNALCAKARELGIRVVAGLAEGTRARWYNTSAIIDPSGTVLYSLTKNYPTAGEIDGGVLPGDSFEVVDTEVGRLGIVICADFAFFKDGVETSKRERERADILLNPALWFALSEAFPHTVIGRNMEYSVPVVGVEPGALVRDLPRLDVPARGWLQHRVHAAPRHGSRPTLGLVLRQAGRDRLDRWLRVHARPRRGHPLRRCRHRRGARIPGLLLHSFSRTGPSGVPGPGPSCLIALSDLFSWVSTVPAGWCISGSEVSAHCM